MNENKSTVTVGAGVSQRQLLDFLGEHKTAEHPEGWTLPAFSWFIDQTIGGAISTGTHGSSLVHGSLSNAIVKMRVVLPSGHVKSITRKRSAHLFRAFVVGVGRPGIVIEVTMKIVPQAAVKRSNRGLSFESFVDDMRVIQETYRLGKQIRNATLMSESLMPIDETQCFWHVPSREVWRLDFKKVYQFGSDMQVPHMKAFSGPSNLYVERQEEKINVGTTRALTIGASFWSNAMKKYLQDNVEEGTFESRKAYLSMTEEQTRFHSGWTGYDQYEVSVPMDTFSDCMEMIGDEMYGSDALWEGFRTPILIRFVAEEEAYLSNTHGGPRAYFNMEDYISYNTKRDNNRFLRIVDLFRTRCNARLHWGKAGWPRFASCFDGAREYPESWCSFGCVVLAVDPNGKFSKESDVWEWRALDEEGQDIDFKECCSSTGFIHSKCTCVSRSKC